MSILWILTFFGTMAISLWAAARVKSAYARGSEVPASSGYTGAEAAAKILDAAGIHDVEITEHDGLLGDHYDPIKKRLCLSSDVYRTPSVAALSATTHAERGMRLAVFMASPGRAASEGDPHCVHIGLLRAQ
jgi:Zn-dependent membrane protease YugP